MSASEASKQDNFNQYARATYPCLTSRHWPGTYRTGRLTGHGKTIKMSRLRVFWQPRLAPYPCGRGDDGDMALLGIFGMSVLVVEKVWELLERDSLLPEDSHPKHLLWALHFMNEYPKQSPGCSAVGASAGAVSPKTNRKWVWAFIDAVANLVNVVVSN